MAYRRCRLWWPAHMADALVTVFLRPWSCAGATIDLQPNEVTYPIATVHTNTNTQHHTRSSGRKVRDR